MSFQIHRLRIMVMAILGFVGLQTACNNMPVLEPTSPILISTISLTNTLEPTVTYTNTPEPTLTPTSTDTLTPTPTFSPTSTPTVIGGSEPKIAFLGKDLNGNFNLYTDGLFTGQPKIIKKFIPTEEDNFSTIKWSPDGKKLIFTNGDENQERWLFVFDVFTNDLRQLYKIPAGKYVDAVYWSEDNSIATIVTANLRPPGPNLAQYEINIIDGTSKRVQIGNFWINNVTRVYNQASCYKNFGRDLAKYKDVCYFPEIGLYGGFDHGENSSDYVLLSEDGQIQKILMKFPTAFNTNGAINLLLSPDKSQVLMIGQPNHGVSFVFPIALTSESIESAGAETFSDFDDLIFQATPPPHVLTQIDVFGWSPDSGSYLAALFYADSLNVINYTAQWEFVVVNADTGDFVKTYSIPNDIQPFLGYNRGYDLVWP